mmetsp:Transcript_31377/g.55172  ORF Transcript_31377/g.55172 Transcript_31377/m.55172 type:complete len:209 (-) Transcript_31377:1867-2493(-)
MASVFCTTCRSSSTAKQYRWATSSPTLFTNHSPSLFSSLSSSPTMSLYTLSCWRSGSSTVEMKSDASVGGALPVILYFCFIRGTRATSPALQSRDTRIEMLSTHLSRADRSSDTTSLKPPRTSSLISSISFWSLAILLSSAPLTMRRMMSGSSSLSTPSASACRSTSRASNLATESAGVQLLPPPRALALSDGDEIEVPPTPFVAQVA